MKSFYSRTILLLVLIHISYGLLFAQSVNWETTEKVYAKFSHELSLTKAQNITRLSKSAYLMSIVELSEIDLNDVLFISPIWQSEEGLESYAIDNSIILYDVYSLNALIKDNKLNTNIISIDSIAGEPLIYILSLRDISYKQIDSICAVLMAESYCKIAEPNYVFFSTLQDDISPDPSGNTYYTDQWGLNNSSLPNYDINARDAWRISTGEGIKVAVIDVGFELTHPDLFDNIYSSYDCTDGEDGAQNGAYGIPIDSHGTQCAGVIGAVNNNIGVVGVAPDSKLILLRRGYTVISGEDTIFYAQNVWHINALRTAYQLGADVISNSWSMNASSNNFTIFDEVLEEAYTLGRSGKGAVVVFSTGNQNKTFINYPSNSPYTISVGAMNDIGHRCYFSNYGQNLDIVAPGYNIWTTQIIPYGSYCYSSGTSFAAPMVSSVAALMLSINPDLTSSEVGNIIRTTAYKLPYYDFSETNACGSWNNYVGYGLIDAEASVVTAAGGYIQGPKEICDGDTAKYYLINPLQSGETVVWNTYSGMNLHPVFSIVGSSTQDTVYVRCQYIDSRLLDPVDPSKYLSATITSNNGTTSETYKKYLSQAHSEVPTISASNTSTLWMAQTQRTFTITNCTDVPDNSLKWTVKRKRTVPGPSPLHPMIYTSYYYGRTLNYTPPTPVSVTCPDTLTIFATNLDGVCGAAKSTSLQFIVIPRNLHLTGHDDGEQLSITISEENEERQYYPAQLDEDGEYTLELWHSLYGSMRTQRALSANEQMNISGFPQGVYVLLLKTNGTVVTETKVQIQ